MRNFDARVSLLSQEEWPDEISGLTFESNGEKEALNIFKALAHHPKALKRWLVFANHTMYKSTLTLREREVLILRTGWLTQSEYVWTQHVKIALQIGMTEVEIQAVKQPEIQNALSERERLLVGVVEEIITDKVIGADTWNRLTEYYSIQNSLDIMFTVGNYQLLSVIANSLVIPLERGTDTSFLNKR